MNIVLTFLIVIISLVILVRSADLFVDQASALAKKFGLSDFLIGFTVVAFGTSLPELISTLFSAQAGHNQLVVSNIIGSNITNICLIFGLVAILKKYRIRKRDIDINIPLNLAALMFFWVIATWSGFSIGWSFGISLILIFLILIILSKEYNHLPPTDKKYSTYRTWILLTSLFFLVASGKVCIQEIIALSKILGIAESILGYFVLALGTSLPELITTYLAVRKNEGELGVGNILGSNLFNLLFILGIATFFNPVQIASFVPDLIFLSITTLTLYALAIFGKKYFFSRQEGLGLLLIYLLFIIMQVGKI